MPETFLHHTLPLTFGAMRASLLWFGSFGSFASLFACALTLGCNKTDPKPAAPDPSAATAPAATPASGVATTSAGTTDKAEVGKPAPDFSLKDTEGNLVRLADFKGKTVVVEWFNPDCPFVKKSHEKGSLKGYAQAKVNAGVTWIAVNSGAPGKQGHGAARNVEAKKAWSLPHPILLDETGQVGKAYGATNTPHMFVVDAAGVLRYAGAIDNSPDAEGESPQGGKLVNYVEQSLSEIAAGKPVSVASTKAYGCSVKY